MYKCNKFIKMIISMFLILLLSIECFAAVISDNDGSAFVTKAEFEALKDNFANQVENYNDSIDSKIDGAISSYLSGITISKTIAVEPIISNYKDIKWMHGPYMYFTNRRFTAYTTTAGSYVDTVNWQIINPENRRQCAADGYLWWHDDAYGSYSDHNITMMLHPYNVPWAWGCGRGAQYRGSSSGIISSVRGPSIFAAMEKESNGWAVYNKDGGFQNEGGHISYLWVRPHRGAVTPAIESLGGVGSGTWLQPNTNSTGLRLTSNALGDGELANYTITGIRYGNESTLNTNGTITSIVTQVANPSLIATQVSALWNDGSDGFPIKTACGYASYMGDYYSRSGNTLVEDNRWKTKTQFQRDMNNFIYAMWGSDVAGEMNVAPPIISNRDFNYIDLSESPNHVTVPFKIANIGIGVQNSYAVGSDWRYGHFQGYKSSPLGDMNLSFPLFYRVKWSDMLSGEFKRNNESLGKSAGYPIIENSDQKGEIKLTINYEERANTDTSVVTLTTDNVIRIYFKNKPFTDTTGTYYRGYKNLEGIGTAVEFNGVEWSDGKITVNIPIEKNDSVWMRIDPLTANGVYCSMTSYNCDLITD